MLLPRKSSLHLVGHDSLGGDASFLIDGLGDVLSLVAKHLEGELYGLVLGLGHSAVRQLLDELRLRLELWLRHEVEGAIRHLLCDALAAETWQHACHRLVGREEEMLALIIGCHAAELSVAAGSELNFFNFCHNLKELRVEESLFKKRKVSTITPETLYLWRLAPTQIKHIVLMTSAKVVIDGGW